MTRADLLAGWGVCLAIAVALASCGKTRRDPDDNVGEGDDVGTAGGTTSAGGAGTFGGSGIGGSGTGGDGDGATGGTILEGGSGGATACIIHPHLADGTAPVLLFLAEASESMLALPHATDPQGTPSKFIQLIGALRSTFDRNWDRTGQGLIYYPNLPFYPSPGESCIDRQVAIPIAPLADIDAGVKIGAFRQGVRGSRPTADAYALRSKRSKRPRSPDPGTSSSSPTERRSTLQTAAGTA